MRKMKSKLATKTATVRRTKKKTAKKVTAKRNAFDTQMGRATGRDASALKRREELIQDYIRDGMDPVDARQRAIAVMRDNTKMDWRRG